MMKDRVGKAGRMHNRSTSTGQIQKAIEILPCVSPFSDGTFAACSVVHLLRLESSSQCNAAPWVWRVIAIHWTIARWPCGATGKGNVGTFMDDAMISHKAGKIVEDPHQKHRLVLEWVNVSDRVLVGKGSDQTAEPEAIYEIYETCEMDRREYEGTNLDEVQYLLVELLRPHDDRDLQSERLAGIVFVHRLNLITGTTQSAELEQVRRYGEFARRKRILVIAVRRWIPYVCKPMIGI